MFEKKIDAWSFQLKSFKFKHFNKTSKNCHYSKEPTTPEIYLDTRIKSVCSDLQSV